MAALDSSQRKRLRGFAHALEPVVQVGKGGATAELIAQVDRALDAHELIKVRFVAAKPEKRALIAELCARTGAMEAGTVGHVAILYRPARDPGARRFGIGPP